MANPNISYLLVAEFDITKGSTVTLQYPSEIPGYHPDTLADQMLPDGASNQEWMCNFFFLNHRKQRSKTKMLEEWEVVPSESEKGGSVNIEKSDDSETEKMNDLERTSQFLYCVNLIYTRKDSTKKRGATIRALCLCTQHSYSHVWKEVLSHALAYSFETEDPSIFSDLYTTLNAIDLSDVNLRRQRCSVFNSYWHNEFPSVEHITSFLWNGHSHIISIPITSPLLHPHASVRLLVETFERKVMILLHALLRNDSILILGASPEQVGIFVLSCCALISPPLQGIVEARAFPYVNFIDVSYRSVKGYVAGTVNPALVSQGGWDILANVTTGQILDRNNFIAGSAGDSSEIQFFGKTSSSVVSDISKISSKIGHDPKKVYYFEKIEKSLLMRLPEGHLQHLFCRYTIRILDVALGCEFYLEDRDDIARKDAEYYNEIIARLKESEPFLRYAFDLGESANESKDTEIVLQIFELIRQIEFFCDQNCKKSGPNMTFLDPNFGKQMPKNVPNDRLPAQPLTTTSTPSVLPSPSVTSPSSVDASFLPNWFSQFGKKPVTQSTPTRTSQAPPNATPALSSMQISPTNTKVIYEWRHQKQFERIIQKLCDLTQNESHVFGLLIALTRYNIVVSRVAVHLNLSVPLLIQFTNLIARVNALRSRLTNSTVV
jgi:hypothetical protein